MKTLVRSLLPLLAVGLCALAPAQQDTSGTQTGGNQQAEDKLVSLDFPGGTLGEFVQHLQRAAGIVNVLLVDDARAWPVPPIRVSKVQVAQALKAVEQATWTEDGKIDLRPSNGRGEPIWTIRVERRTKKAPPPDEQVLVVSLTELTQPAPGDPADAPVTLRPETVLTAIEAGSKDFVGVPELRFHRESGLLFVKGDVQQLSLVREVMGNLERDVSTRRNRAAQARAQSRVQEQRETSPRGDK